MKLASKIIGGIFAFLFLVLIIICERDRPVDELIPLYANQDSKFMPILGMNVHYRVVPEAIHAVAESLHVRCC
jgi:hypothetical protein